MDRMDERTKKLKAGKEKLAAFLKKKSKAKKTDKEDKDTTGPQNEEEQGFSEVLSPSAFSNTDSDQFSFTSGDEWSTEESELKFRMLYEPELADVEQNVVNTERSRHTLGSYILQSSSSEQNIISDIESALSKRDELISKLTESLQASFWQNIPNDEVMTQVQALVEHVGTLQTQLLQADQSLQEQLELHEASALALQSAKEQMLQLQFILHCKDAELDRIIKTVHKNTQSIHSYGMKEINTENCQESCLMCEQYSGKVRILEEELYSKIRECERWSSSQQEWLAREQKLLSSVSAESQEGVLFQESHQLGEHDIMYTCESQLTSLHEQEASNGDKEQLHTLEFQLAKLKREHYAGDGKISTLKQNSKFEAGASDISQPSSCGSIHNEYATQHSQCLSQIEHLTSLNLDLQEKLSALSSVEKDLAVLRCDYEKLSASYQDEIETKFHNSESYAQLNAMYSSEKGILLGKIAELQNEVVRLQTLLHSSVADDNSGEKTLVAQLQRELMQRDDELRVSLTQLTEVHAMSNKQRYSYEGLERSVLSYEEVIAGLTQQLQAAEHGQKDAELEVMTQKLKIEQVVHDVQNRLIDKDLECKQYTENIIQLQDELLSNQHIHSVEISEKDQQLESIKDHMTVLDSERAKLMEKVKHLEHRLKMECQQYMDNLQHVMAEKELECRQYTENIVRLQDELMSFRHAHDIEISEKNYYFDRVEEQVEVLSTEKANFEQKVKDLEHKLAASYQQNIEDVSDIKHEMEVSSSNGKDGVKIQNELLTTQSVNKLQMLEKVSRTERFEEEVEVLVTEKTALSQRVNILEQELHAQCKQMKEAEGVKAEIESQLQVVLADRESLQTNVDALTTEMYFLKKNLQDSHSEQKRSVNQDLSSVHNGSVDNLDSATEMEQGLDSYLYEVHDISDSENKDLLHTPNLTLHHMVGKFEYERKLAIQCRNETEQLKAKISVIDMNEERHIKAALQVIVDDLLRAQVEFSRHIESLLKQVVCFETQELEKSSCQAELLEQKQVIQSEPDLEVCQEALQAQLKSTVSQWQKLQVIVQEKEIELHRLQENFDEQQRISSSMMRFQEEQRHLLQTEIESLKTVIEEKNKAGIQIDNQQYDLHSSVDNVSTELNEIIHKVSDNETALNNDEYLAQRETELSDLKTSLALKESENFELVSSLTLFQEEIVNLKNKICDLQHHGKTKEENMKQKESEVGILEDSLYGSIDEKEIDLINWKIFSESQVRDLKSVITERESEIDRLKLVNADIFSENTSLKNQLEVRDVATCDLKSCLANTAAEVNVLNNVVADSKAETEDLKNQFSSKESEVEVLRNTIAAKESEVNVFKEALVLKQTEINALQHHFENVKSENTVLKSILAEKESEMVALTLSLADSKSNKELNLKRSDTENNARTDALGNVKVDRESEKDTSKEILDEAEIPMNVLALTERKPEISSLQQHLLHTETRVGELTKDCVLKDTEIEILVASLADRNCEIHSLKSCLSVEDVKMVNFNKGVAEKNACELDSAETKNSLAQTEQIISLQSTLKDNEAQVLELKIKLSEKESEILSLKNDLTNKDSKMLTVKKSLEVNEHEASDFKNTVTGTLSEKVDYLQEKLKDKDEVLYSTTQGRYEVNAELATAKLQLEDNDGDAREVITAQESETKMLKERLIEAENQNIILQTSIIEREEELVAVRNYITEKNSENMVLKDKLSEIISQNDMLQDAVTQTDDALADVKQILAETEVEVSSLGRINDSVCYRDELQTTASEVDLEMTNLKQSLAEKEFEISTLKVDLNETKNQIQTLQATCRQVDEEMASGRNIVLEKDSQIKVLTEKLVESEIKTDAFKTSLDETEDRLMKLRHIVGEKDSEIYTLTGKVSDAISQVDLIQSDLIKKDEELVALRQAALEKESEISILAERFDGSSSQLDVLNNLVSNTNKELADMVKSVKEKDSEICGLKETLCEASENESQVLTLIEELSKATNKVDSLNEIVDSKNEELATIQSMLENRGMEIRSLNEQLQEVSSQMDVLCTDYRNANEELIAVKRTSENKAIEISSLKEQLQETSSEVDVLNAELRKANEEVATIKSSLENKESEINSLNEQIQEANSNVSALHSSLRHAEEEATSIKTSLENKDLEMNTLNEKLQEANRHVDLLNIDLTKANEELAAIQNTIENKDMEINTLNEKLQEANSCVSTQQTDLKNTHEELAALKSCLENKDLEMIALTEKLQEANSCVGILHNDLENTNVELVAIKSTMVTKTLDISVSNEQLQEANSNVQMLHADLNNANEELTAMKRSVENRDLEIGNLNEQLREANSQVDTLHTDLRNAHEHVEVMKSSLENKDMEISSWKKQTEQLQEVSSNVDALHGILKNANEELAAIKTSLQNKDIEISTLNEQLQEGTSQVDVLKTELKESNEELTAIKTSLQNKDIEISTLNEQLKEGTSQVDVLKTELKESNDELIAIKTSLQYKDIEISTLNEQLQKGTSQVDVLKTELKESNDELTAIKNIFGNKDVEITILNEKLQEAKVQMDVQRTDLKNTNEIVQATQTSLENKELEVNTLNEKLQETNSHVDALTSELKKANEELTAVKNTSGNKDIEIVTLSETIQEGKSHVDILHNNLENANEEIASLMSELNKRHMEVQSLNTKLQESSSNVDILHINLRNTHEELATQNCNLESYSLEISNLNEQLQKANNQVDVLLMDLRNANEELIAVKRTSENKTVEISNLKEQLQETSSQVDVLNAELRKANEEVATIKTSLENKDLEMNTLNEKLQEANRHVDLLNIDLTKANEKLAAIQNTIENKDMEINTLNEKLQEANRHVDLLNIDLTKANEKLAAIQNTIENKDMEINTLNEKLHEANSCVSTQQTDLKNTHEELAALKSCLENKDLEMIALTEKLQEANSCVDIVRNDLENTVEELVAIKSTLVNKTLEISVSHEQLQESNSDVQMLHADLRNANENLGSAKSILENKDLEIGNLNEQLQEVSCQVDVLRIDLRNATTELAAVKSTSENKDIEIGSLKEQLQEASSQVDALNTELIKANEEVTAIKSGLENKDWEMNNLNEELQEAKHKVDVLHTDLRNADQELAALKNTLENKELEISTFNERVKEADNSVGILQTDLSNANEELMVLKNGITGKESEICTLKEELSMKESEVRNLSEELLKASSKVEELLLTQKSTNEDLATVNHSLLMNESEMAALNEKLSETSILISSLTTTLSTTTDELAEMKGCVEQKETEISALTERHTEAISQLNILNSNLIKIDEDLKAARDSAVAAESRCTLLEQQLCNSLIQNEAMQTTVKEHEESLTVVTKEKNEFHMQVLTLQDQLQSLEANLHELKTEHSGLMLTLDVSQESKDHMESSVIQKERELSELTSQVTGLEQQIKELSHDAEFRDAAERLQKTEFEAKEEEFEHMRVKLLQEIENLTKSLEEKESAIAKLTAVAATTRSEYVLQELNTERKSLTLEGTLSAMSQEAQEISATIVLQELKLQEQVEEMSQLTDKVNNASEKLQESNEMNISLQQLNEALNSESHAHLTDIIHQREALEQQVVEMEGLLAQKEREISEIMQSAADNKMTLEQLSVQHLTLERNYKTLLSMFSHLQTDILVKESTLIEQNLHIDEQSVRLNDLSETLTRVTLSANEVNESNIALKAEIDALQENKCELEHNISKLQSEFDSQELTATQFMVESKQLSEKLTQMTYDLDTKDATIFDLQHDCEMYIKEINHLKQELEQKDLISISLKQEVESSCSLMERSREEKEMLKANFDSCMEEVQQKLSDQEIELKRLRAQLAEETKNVCQDQNQMKEIYEQQIGQMEEKLLNCEKQCERLEKELTELKVKSASAKDVYEHQLSEQELHLQSTNSELLKLKDHLSKIINNHKCEVAGLKRLHEIQTNELEESCLTLERTVAEQKRLVNENAAKFNREKCNLEQNYEIQLSDVEEKRRVSEMEISRLKKHLDEMTFDHEKDIQSLEKSCEARLYELEDKYCNATNELERLRKSLFSAGGYSEERQALEMRVEELETLRRDLQNSNSLLEDDIAMMRTQAQCREEEMKAVLKNAAEEQQRQTAELNSEILQLQQHLSECDHKHAEIVAETRRQCESQVTELQSRNRQLEEKICSLEILIEEDSALQMAGNKHGSNKKNMSAHTRESTSLKTIVSPLNSPERASTFSAVDPQFSPMDLEIFPSDDHSLGDCLPPSNENVPIVEGFVAEPTVKFVAPRRVSQPNAVSGYNTSVEKADFVEEQCDGFQLEIPEHSLSQCSDHPIHENVIREGFEPEAPDHFLLETLEEPTNTMWQHEMSVDMSPPHMQSQQDSFDFSTPEKPQRNEEFRMQDTLFSNFNTNCNNRDLQSTYQLEKPDVSFEKCLSDIKDELEEEYVTKMRQQEIKLTLEYEANQAEYKREMEQHFDQRMKAVRYEWERKFNKALQKVQKELEKQHRTELRQLESDQYQRQLHQHDPSVSPIAGESSLHEEDDLVSHDTEETETLNQVGDHLLQENQEIAVPSDVLTRQIESTQTMETTAEKQPEIISSEGSSSSSSTTSTPTLTACSPVVAKETGRDEAESSRSEVSDTSSARERFLEELEEMSQQSSQDLPLEWELTSTVIETGNFEPETGNFEREPEHHSVWEVFDGRCVRQDCQEVRHKFHTLYQWVVNLLGDGYDVAFDSEFKLLTELPVDESNSKSSSLNQSEIDSVHSSDSTTRVKDISYAELLARVVSLELTKHRLEEELVAQIDQKGKLQWEMNKQYGVTDADLKAEVTQRGTTVQPQEGYSVLTFNDSDTSTVDDLSNQPSCQGSDASDVMKSLEEPRAQTLREQLQEMDNLLAGESGIPESQGQSVDISSDKVSEHANCIQQDCYSSNYGSFLTSDRNSSECRSDGNLVGNEREIINANIPENNYSNVTLTAEHGSAISVSSNNILTSVYLDGAGNNSWSHVEILDLQDKELAEEISRLQQDLRDTKEVFSKENVLLQEALHKDTLSKNLMTHTASERNVVANANASLNDSKHRKRRTEGNLNMLEQKLTICMEQNQMLEDENVSLRKKIREQAAVINFLKSRLQQKDQETEVWQKSVNKQLITLQNQRSDLLQLLEDMDSGKESKLSDTLQGSIREESLRTAQEDLMARMEELDHLNKMLTQRQIELQHCEAERKHLEQLCLLKDETEMQLMKQKRLMEEQLAQIETHLTERETILVEEKTQLLQELKDKGFHLSKVSELSQTSYQSLSTNIPLSSLPGDMNLISDNSATPVVSLSSPSQSGVVSTAQDVDRQHSEAVEKLRAKLKQYKT